MYDRLEKMDKNSLGITTMNYKILLSAGFLGILLISGCANNNDYAYDYHGQSQTSTEKQVCPAGQYPAPGITGCAPEDEFVNYTKVAGDYREYGERTPRDHLIVHAGAGSNMSATMPPSVEGEVIDYEEEITEGIEGSNNNDTAVGDSGEGYTADDPIEDWLAEEGKSLKSLLTEWCDRAGWRLVWNTSRNYTLTAGAMFRGRFADVSSALVRAFARARPAPIATFYKGNRVLVVETMEDENAYE
jgi:hypothetical protein